MWEREPQTQTVYKYLQADFLSVTCYKLDIVIYRVNSKSYSLVLKYCSNIRKINATKQN